MINNQTHLTTTVNSENHTEGQQFMEIENDNDNNNSGSSSRRV